MKTERKWYIPDWEKQSYCVLFFYWEDKCVPKLYDSIPSDKDIENDYNLLIDGWYKYLKTI